MSSNPLTVLIVDKDNPSREVAVAALNQAGYCTWAASTRQEALRLLERRGWPNAAIIASTLNQSTAVGFCRYLREHSPMPLVLLLDPDQDGTGIAPWLLEECADDFLVKPVRPEELVLRLGRAVRTVLSEPASSLGPSELSPSLSVNLLRQQAFVDGRSVALSERESSLLQLLVRHKNKTLTFDYLISQVWPGELVSEDALRVAIHRLRQKIEASPEHPIHILSVRGRGYTFVGG